MQKLKLLYWTPRGSGRPASGLPGLLVMVMAGRWRVSAGDSDGGRAWTMAMAV